MGALPSVVLSCKFYDFAHRFRQNPDHPGLDLKPLKGDGRVHRAKIDQSYRALLGKIGIDGDGHEKWLVVAVRHRRHVYEELSVAINRITGEIEFVDLSVVGQSVLQRAGMTLTPAEQPEAGDEPETPAPVPATPEPTAITPEVPEAEPLLAGLAPDDLRKLGVAEQLIGLALAVTGSEELDALVSGAPLLTKDILYGLAAGLTLDEVRKEITAPVDVELDESERQDLDAALARTTVTTIDEALKDILEEGDFRAWKVFLHPAQAKLVDRRHSGPFRVSGGPGTGKTIVALHRVKHLAERLPPGHNKPILLTTFTKNLTTFIKNLTTDLRARLASLLEPEQLARVDVTHIDQLAARVLSENTLSGAGKQRISDLNRAMEVVNPKSAQITFDDLDDGTDDLDGYRSVLRGPAPELVPCDSWDDGLVQLAVALKTWREELATGGVDGRPRDPRGTIAVCVADREAANQVMYYLATEAGLTVAELTKDGVKGDGDIHVGTMHRFKGLEYQKLAIMGARDGVIPRASLVQRYRDTDPKRLAREELKARSLLFVAATRARDTLRISWHGKASPYLPR